MPKLTRRPTAEPAKPPAPLDPHPWDKSFDRLEQLTKHWKLVVGIVLPAYALMRILALTKVKRPVLLEVVRRQGVSGIAEAVVTSLVTELGGLILVSMLVFLVWWLSKATPEEKREWGPVVLVGAVPLLLLLLILPLTIVGFVGLLVAVWLGVHRWKRKLELVASVVLIAVALISICVKPFLSAPWLPLEAISWKDPTTGPTTGYVLGEGEGFLSFLQDRDRNILLIPSDALAGRVVCRDPKALVFDAPSILELGWGETPKCPSVPPQGVPPTLPGTTVTTATTVTTTTVDPATTSTTETTVAPATTSTTETTVAPATTTTTATTVDPATTTTATTPPPITRTG